jgi:hypothetical protein
MTERERGAERGDVFGAEGKRFRLRQYIKLFLAELDAIKALRAELCGKCRKRICQRKYIYTPNLA